jgi:hypothetical protein
LDENQSSFGAGGQGLGQAIANGFGLNLANLPDISGNISGIMGTSNTSNSSKNVVYVSLAGANLHNANDWTSKMEEIAQNVLDKNTPTSW